MSIAEAEEEALGKGEGSGRERERELRVKVGEAGNHDGGSGHDHPRPQGNHEPADRRDVAVEERDGEQADTGGNKLRLARGERHQVGEVLREADVARSDLERARQNELPDEHERQQAAEPRAREGHLQVLERAARGGPGAGGARRTRIHARRCLGLPDRARRASRQALRPL